MGIKRAYGTRLFSVPKITTIAIAGLGGVAKTIAEVLTSNAKFQVLFLSRKDGKNLDLTAPVLTVDYSDVAGLAETLASNHVHRVISAIRANSAAESASEVNLVQAANKEASTKRFISSDYGGPWPKPEGRSPTVKVRLATVEALRATTLEYTTIHIGQFLDFLAMPGLKTHLRPSSIWFDLKNRAAAIPGTGVDIATFTYSYDMARFVEAALDMPEWPKDMNIAGDKLPLNDILRLFEDAKDSPWTVAYDDAEKIKRGEMTELPAHIPLYEHVPKARLQTAFTWYSYWLLIVLLDWPEEEGFNKLCPDIETMSIKEAIAIWKEHNKI